VIPAGVQVASSILAADAGNLAAEVLDIVEPGRA
jgi:hypothetical protein